MECVRKNRAGKYLALVGCLAVMLSAAACGPSAEEQASAAIDALWGEVQAAKSELDAKRADLASATAAVEAAIAEEVEDVTDLQTAVSAAQDAANAAGDTFNEKLIGYLNEDAMLEGEPPTPRQMEAIRMKSAEDILIASEFIDMGGNYKRAIDIYNQSMLLDPDNPDLQAALAHAEEMRYMTEERLAQVKKKMSPDEVRELLGPVNLNFIKKYDDRGVTAWFYPREDGGAAAVFFEKRGDSERVYEINYEATKPPESS